MQRNTSDVMSHDSKQNMRCHKKANNAKKPFELLTEPRILHIRCNEEDNFAIQRFVFNEAERKLAGECDL